MDIGAHTGPFQETSAGYLFGTLDFWEHISSTCGFKITRGKGQE